MVSIPPYFLFFLAFCIIATILAYFTVEGPATIDIGVRIIRPLAQFKIGDRQFRIQLLPLGIYSDDMYSDDTAYTAIFSRTAAILVPIVFVMNFALYWFDGWPDLEIPQGTSQSPGVTQAGQGERHSWDQITSNASIRIIEVEEKSPAAQAGLQCEDIITSIDGKPIPSLLEAARTLSGFQEAQLNINRFGKKITINLSKHRSPDKKERRYGFSIALALKLEKELVVQKVKFGSSAYRSGIKPGDIVTISPMDTPYLSKQILLHKIKEKSISHINVRPPPPASTETFLFKRKSEPRKVKKIDAGKLDAEWFESMQLKNSYYQYKPGFRENLKFTILSPIAQFLHLDGKHLVAKNHFPVFCHGFAPHAGVLKKHCFFFAAMSVFMLIYAIIVYFAYKEYMVLITIVFSFTILSAVVFLVLYFIFPSVIDSLLLFAANHTPFSETMITWSL